MFLIDRYNIYDAFTTNFFFLQEIDVMQTAAFSTFTHTQTRGLLAKAWFEYELSGINWSMSGVKVWYSQRLLDLSSLECQCLNNDL